MVSSTTSATGPTGGASATVSCTTTAPSSVSRRAAGASGADSGSAAATTSGPAIGPRAIAALRAVVWPSGKVASTVISEGCGFGASVNSRANSPDPVAVPEATSAPSTSTRTAASGATRPAMVPDPSGATRQVSTLTSGRAAGSGSGSGSGSARVQEQWLRRLPAQGRAAGPRMVRPAAPRPPPSGHRWRVPEARRTAPGHIPGSARIRPAQHQNHHARAHAHAGPNRHTSPPMPGVPPAFLCTGTRYQRVWQQDSGARLSKSICVFCGARPGHNPAMPLRPAPWAKPSRTRAGGWSMGPAMSGSWAKWPAPQRRRVRRPSA